MPNTAGWPTWKVRPEERVLVDLGPDTKLGGDWILEIVGEPEHVLRPTLCFRRSGIHAGCGIFTYRKRGSWFVATIVPTTESARLRDFRVPPEIVAAAVNRLIDDRYTNAPHTTAVNPYGRRAAGRPAMQGRRDPMPAVNRWRRDGQGPWMIRTWGSAGGSGYGIYRKHGSDSQPFVVSWTPRHGARPVIIGEKWTVGEAYKVAQAHYDQFVEPVYTGQEPGPRMGVMARVGRAVFGVPTPSYGTRPRVRVPRSQIRFPGWNADLTGTAFYARRGSDGATVRVARDRARRIAQIPPGQTREWTALWYVNPAWNAAGEGKWRVDNGWAPMIWEYHGVLPGQRAGWGGRPARRSGRRARRPGAPLFGRRNRGGRRGNRYEADEWLDFFSDPGEPTAKAQQLGGQFEERVDALLDQHGFDDYSDDVYYLTYASLAGHGVGLWEGREPWHTRFEPVVKADRTLAALAHQLDYEFMLAAEAVEGSANRGRAAGRPAHGRRWWQGPYYRRR